MPSTSRRLTTRAVTLVATLAAALTFGASQAAHASSSPVRHVWVIELENKSYMDVLGTGDGNHYLTHTLPSLGVVMTNYYAVGHESLDNYIAQMSGQAPNVLTQADCPRYMNVIPGIMGPNQQAIGLGCVMPTSAPALPNQLVAKGLTWKGYMEDMGNNPTRDNTNALGDCGHPILNSTDGTQTASATDQYASRHDPFIYFHSIIDSPKLCDDVVPLTRLRHDLAKVSTTPNFSWITPNLCDDGHDATCAGLNVDGTHAGGLTGTADWLAKYLPLIMSSPAYKQNGAIVITWDESDTTDGSSCCGEIPGPGSPLPGIVGSGGGHIATVVISPFTKPGSKDATAYNHYSLLRSLEDLFGVGHLGMAARPGLHSFGSDVFNR